MENKLNYSSPIVQKSIEVFSTINIQINSLIDCSVKDFEILNQNFKNYYNEINLLTNQTNDFINILSEIPDKSIKNLLIQIRENEIETRKFYLSVTNFDHFIKHTEKSLSLALLYIRNLKQNIGTIKLLTTNIQFEPQFQSLYIKIIQILDNLITCFSKLDNEFHFLFNRIEQFESILEEIKTARIPALLNILTKLKTTLDALTDTKDECHEYKIKLDGVNAKKNIINSEIITNLQFQDIIRQKIEHVQKAHILLLNNLKTENSKNQKNDKLSENGLSKIPYQIRDIGSLQASQLVHANNEYQKAIEKITNKFGDLDNLRTETMLILNKLLYNNETKEEFLFSSLEKFISIFVMEVKTLSLDNSDLSSINDDIFPKIHHTQNSNKSILHWLEQADMLIKELNPIQSVNDGRQFGNPINELFFNLEKLKATYLQIVQIDPGDNNIPGSFNMKEFEDYLTLFNKIEILSEEIVVKLKKFPILSKNKINLEMRPLKGNDINWNEFSLDQVKYYKIFDIEVDKIINLLNILISQMDLERNSVKPETIIDKLKKFYTMDSERHIHRLYTGGTDENHKAETDIELF